MCLRNTKKASFVHSQDGKGLGKVVLDEISFRLFSVTSLDLCFRLDPVWNLR